MSRNSNQRSKQSKSSHTSLSGPPFCNDNVADDCLVLRKETLPQKILTATTPVISKTFHVVADFDYNKKKLFISRKRKLKRIDFVKPRVNGVVQEFDFLFELGQLSPGVVAVQNIVGNCATSSILSTPTYTECTSTNYSKSNTEKRKIHETFILEQQIINADMHKISDMDERIHQPMVNKKSVSMPLKTLNSTTEFSSQSTRQRCSLSGISVEDAVRDRLGLRPRSNSTDGELKLPQRGLCYEHEVLAKFQWKFEMRAFPAGFNNLGNTCFLNSTLQCLAYLPPFCQSLMEMNEEVLKSTTVKGKRMNPGKNITCVVRSIFLRIHAKNNDDQAKKSISPSAIVALLPTLGAIGSRDGYRFRSGRQEDAHEFLVHLLDAMHIGELQEAGINPHKSGWRDKLPVARLDETTFIHRIFGGYFRSQVRCTNCSYRSNTYDPFLDLSLEISKSSCESIISAFRDFSRKETLDKNNRWKCSGCQKRVCASKQLTVFRPPLSLCIQLKRFSFKGSKLSVGGCSGGSHFGGGMKISKKIEFPARFELPLSDGRSCWYSLSGIVVHVGNSASSGHYTAFVKRPRNNSHQWFFMDDSYATPVTEHAALRQRDAYLLFYCREEVKLEFPSPPQKSMSASEALELSRQKILIRADSTTEEFPGNIRPLNQLVLDGVKHQYLSSPCIVDKPLSTDGIEYGGKSELPLSKSKLPVRLEGAIVRGQKDTIQSSVSKGEGISKTTSTSQNIAKKVKATSKTEPPVSAGTVPPSLSCEVKILTADYPDGSLPIKMVSDSEVKFIKACSEMPSHAKPITIDSDSTANAAILIQQEKKNENGDPEKRGVIVTSSPKADCCSVTSPRANYVSKKSKKNISITSDRDGAQVQVVMRSLSSAAKKVWNPRMPLDTKCNSFGLLGNVSVSKWDESGDAASLIHKSKSGGEQQRVKLLDQMKENERMRKKRFHTDRWDSVLDQGKKKKVKMKSNSSTMSTSGNNPFQRIQTSLLHMELGRRNSHFQPKHSDKT